MKEYIEQKNTIEINFDIILKEPLNVKAATQNEGGSQDKETQLLKTGYKNGDFKDSGKKELENFGFPFIPGSSIRGAIMSQYEKISKILGVKNDELLPNIDRKSRIFIDDAFEENAFKDNAFKDNKNSNIKIIHAYTPMRTGKPYPLTIEVMLEGTILKSKMIVRNIDCKELYKLLLVFADSYNDEIRLGSNKARGLGLVNLKITDISLDIKDKNNKYLNEEEILQYFDIDDKKSIKLDNSYLKKVLKIKDEYNDFDFSESNIEKLKNNKFLLYIQERGI